MAEVTAEMREAMLANLRDRRLIKYLFDADPDNCFPYGYVERPIDLEIQHEIVDTLARIVLERATPPAVSGRSA